MILFGKMHQVFNGRRNFPRRYFGFCVAMVVLFVLVYAVGTVILGTIDKRVGAFLDIDAVDYRATKENFVERIQKSGGDAVWGELLADSASMSQTRSHTLAHIFGEALFEVEGVDGFSSCGVALLYGCIHQFMGMAISTHGAAVATRLYEECIQKPGGGSLTCLHAMGHGFVGYYGYSSQNLQASMQACDQLEPEQRPYFYRCLNGVFMEYNFHILDTAEGTFGSRRPLEETNRYTPCDSLEGRHALSCFRQLPLWWFKSDTGSTPDAAIEKIGRYCDVQKVGSDARRYCFMGVGFVVAKIADVDPSVANRLCRTAAESPEEFVQCFSEFVYQLHINGVMDYVLQCSSAGLTGELLKYCIDRASYPV